MNKNQEYSISDLSTFFQTKMPMGINGINKKNGVRRNLDESETKIENFRQLLKQVKEIVDGKH